MTLLVAVVIVVVVVVGDVGATALGNLRIPEAEKNENVRYYVRVTPLFFTRGAAAKFGKRGVQFVRVGSLAGK